MQAPDWRDPRLAALWRFAVAISAFNLLGHTWLGFEQSWAQPLVGLVVAYGVELLLETLEARVSRREVRFKGGFGQLVSFLLPAHITGLAVAMLLYANERLLPIAFAVAVAIASKYILRVSVAGQLRHFLNPSNFGISVTLLLFPWVGIAMPYMFTENLKGAGNWILPLLLVLSGTFLNVRFTHKVPLIVAWLGTFFLQAALRSVFLETPLVAGLLPMTGVAFILFTFYMVTDPSTTPRSVPSQILFGSGVALVYGLLMAGHVVFTMFFALSLVCCVRGVALFVAALREAQEPKPKAFSLPLPRLTRKEADGVGGAGRTVAGGGAVAD